MRLDFAAALLAASAATSVSAFPMQLLQDPTLLARFVDVYSSRERTPVKRGLDARAASDPDNLIGGLGSLLGGVVGGVGSTVGGVVTKVVGELSLGELVTGLLNGTLPGVQLPPVQFPGLGNVSIEIPGIASIGRKAIPDADHPFKAPGPTDQRGGCPGLNIMANYGYLDRSGVTDLGQLLWAQQEALGLAPDLAAALVALTVISVTDLSTLKLSIGNADSRTSGPLSSVFGSVAGMFDVQNHNTYEVDGSIAFSDTYWAKGNVGNEFNATRWNQAIAVAQANGNQFGQDWSGALRYAHYQQCIAENPACEWGPKQLVFYLAGQFPQSVMPSSDGNGVPTAPTLDVVSKFWGVVRHDNGTLEHVPEQLPAGPDGIWWRRSIPLTLAQLAALGVEAFLAHPVVFGSNSGAVNTFTGAPGDFGDAIKSPEALCVVFNVLNEFVPGPLRGVQSSLTALLNLLLAPARESIGCN